MQRFRLPKPLAIPSRFPSIALRSNRKPPSPVYPKLSLSSIHQMSSTSANDPYFKYMPLEEVEKLEGYRPGGYHPVAIGDRLHDRYRIVHKLGFGGYSTIWLANDEKASKYVAVKILIADSKSVGSSIVHELNSLDFTDRHPGRHIVQPVLDEFVIKGPNGEHRCLITDPASMSLSDARESSYKRIFQLPVARVVIAQLAQAVAFLHTQGFVHADIHLGNILWRLPRSMDKLSLDQFYARYGHPNCEPVTRLDHRELPAGVPSHGIMPVWLGKDSELISLPEARVLLSDFDESFKPSITIRHYSNTPILSAPPEIHFLSHEPLSFPSDIWSLACAIYSIIGTRPLFEGLAPNTDWMAMEYVTVLGRLPFKWWERWDQRLKWFNEDGTRNSPNLGPSWTERFEIFAQKPRQKCGMEVIADEEKAALFAMLKAMLAFRPEERLTAEEVLESKWMKEWALPELEKMEIMRE